jgi:hypothetical protein
LKGDWKGFRSIRIKEDRLDEGGSAVNALKQRIEVLEAERRELFAVPPIVFSA